MTCHQKNFDFPYRMVIVLKRPVLLNRFHTAPQGKHTCQRTGKKCCRCGWKAWNVQVAMENNILETAVAEGRMRTSTGTYSKLKINNPGATESSD